MILPQILVCVILACALLVDFISHGETYEVKRDFGQTAIRTLIWLALLTWGGFFRGGTL